MEKYALQQKTINVDFCCISMKFPLRIMLTDSYFVRILYCESLRARSFHPEWMPWNYSRWIDRFISTNID